MPKFDRADISDEVVKCYNGDTLVFEGPRGTYFDFPRHTDIEFVDAENEKEAIEKVWKKRPYKNVHMMIAREVPKSED